MVFFICFPNLNRTFCKQTVTIQTTQSVASYPGLLYFPMPNKMDDVRTYGLIDAY